MKKVGWLHPVDASDQWDGFNEPGIEHFSGSPIRHLAREVNQNSLDSQDEVTGGAVKVRIRKKQIKVAEIPNVDELKKTFTLCMEAAQNESSKARQFFEMGLKELNKSKISVLEIADSNTKGMRGPAKNGTAYYAFMKAKGQSKKASETAAGSFGIGKFAPYAVSKLRTVFVSTVFIDENEKATQLSQGKSILMSHDGPRSQRHQGIGFWGVTEKCHPIENSIDSLPAWLSRCPEGEELSNHVGTKLVVLGFDDQPGWQQSLTASIAENFFGAISEGNLEVDIDGQFILNATSIETVFSDDQLKEKIANDKNEPEQFENSSQYHACLKAHDEAFLEQHQNLHLGLCELKIVVKEGLPKRVAFLRNGMFISDSLGLPGLRNFSEFKDFVAVFQCKDKKGVELLRAMEPPRHDDFEPDRLPNREEQARAKKALKELAAWIRDMLKRRAKDPVSDVTKIDELKEFFADDSGTSQGDGAEEVNPFGKVIITAKPVAVKKPKSFAMPNGDVGNGTNNGGEVGGSEGERANEGDGVGGDNANSGSVGSGHVKQLASLSNLRAVITSSKSRRLTFTPQCDGRLDISVFEVGADSDYQIGVSGTSAGTLKNGRVQIDALKGVRQSLEVDLNEEFGGALKVVAHEV
jgi:hypothetical protein